LGARVIPSGFGGRLRRIKHERPRCCLRLTWRSQSRPAGSITPGLRLALFGDRFGSSRSHWTGVSFFGPLLGCALASCWWRFRPLNGNGLRRLGEAAGADGRHAHGILGVNRRPLRRHPLSKLRVRRGSRLRTARDGLNRLRMLRMNGWLRRNALARLS
jgi:hypothetical protein